MGCLLIYQIPCLESQSYDNCSSTLFEDALAEPWLGENLIDLAFRANRRIAVYNDTDPVILSWLHAQHGAAFLRNQMLEKALRFFKAAHERLPRYFLATEHLAETHYRLGHYQRAAELYRQVSQQTRNPVFYAKLAKAEQALGNEGAARRAESKARARFEIWLHEHPKAAWQHAAEFYLSRGEPGRVAALARFNAELRQNMVSFVVGPGGAGCGKSDGCLRGLARRLTSGGEK